MLRLRDIFETAITIQSNANNIIIVFIGWIYLSPTCADPYFYKTILVLHADPYFTPYLSPTCADLYLYTCILVLHVNIAIFTPHAQYYTCRPQFYTPILILHVQTPIFTPLPYTLLTLKYGVNQLSAPVSSVLCQNLCAILTATGSV